MVLDRFGVPEQEARVALGINLDARDVDAVRAQRREDVRAGRVVADAAQPADAVAEPGQADRDVRLGAA